MIYYWITSEATVFRLYVYEKTSQDNLTTAQAKVLRKLVEEELS